MAILSNPTPQAAEFLEQFNIRMEALPSEDATEPVTIWPEVDE
jgi:hypothetical protein